MHCGKRAQASNSPSSLIKQPLQDAPLPLLKKRRLSSSVLDTSDDLTGRLLLRDALTAVRPLPSAAHISTLPSPRPLARKKRPSVDLTEPPQEEPEEDVVQEVSSCQPLSSKGLLDQNSFIAGAVQQLPRKPLRRTLATTETPHRDRADSDPCRVAYCSKCASNVMSSPSKFDKCIMGLWDQNSIVFQQRLLFSRSAGRSAADVSTFYASGCASPLLRCQIVGFLVNCQSQLPSPLSPNTFHLGLSIFDRFLLKNADVPGIQSELPKIAGAALILASKMEDVWALHVDDVIISGGHQFTSNEILYWEVQVLQALDFNLMWPTAYSFVTGFLQQALAQGAHRRGMLCHCQSCRQCGVTSDRLIDPVLWLALKDLGAEKWNPKYRSGQGKLAIHACALYTLDIILCHPESLKWESSWIAAVAIVIAVDVLNTTRRHSTMDLLPAGVQVFLDSEEFLESIASVVGIMEEHILGLEAAKHLARETAKKAAPLKQPQCDADDPKYIEAMAETDPKERHLKLTVFYMLKANKEGVKLSLEDARQKATQVLEEHCHVNDENQGPQKPSHYIITEQKPKQNEQNLPLGKFALDIYATHRDAAELFIAHFKSWIERKQGVQWSSSQFVSSQTPWDASLGLDEIHESQCHLSRRTRSKSVAPGSGHHKKSSSRRRRMSCPPESRESLPSVAAKEVNIAKTPIGSNEPVKIPRKSLIEDHSGRNTGSTVASV